MKKDKNFKQKNNFILKKVCNEELDEFVKLFHIKGGKTSFENRRTYLKANWLAKEIVPKKFKKEYEEYPFSNLTYNGKLLFKDAEEFLTIGLMAFEERIEHYVEYRDMLVIPKKLDYSYLYVYNRYRTQENKHVDYYKIEHISQENNSVEIAVAPPKHKNSLQIKSYEGTLKQENNKIILNFYNSDDYITAIFNAELGNDFSNSLTGVAIGIADINKKIPVSKKVILSKTAIEDTTELYLTLNESEILSAEEDYYYIKHNNNRYFKKSHLAKYVKKVYGLNSLFKNISELEYFNSFYEQLAFKEFSSLNHIFQKIKHNKSYYTTSRRKVLTILLNSYHTQKYTSVNMVMPLYQSDNIFEHQSTHALTIQNRFLELSREVSVNIVFVVKDCKNPFSREFKIFLTQIQSSANVSFAYKEDIEYEVNSIDFFYTDNNYVVSKSLRFDNPMFDIFQDTQIIEGHQAIYRKIALRSISYEEFMQNRAKICSKTNPLLKNLSGIWYHYIYGSKQFWEDKIQIFENGKVEYYSEEKKTELGEIIVKEYESIMLLDDPVTKRAVTVVFNNQLYQIQKAFFTKVIAKQLETDLDMFSIGILSRRPIPKDRAMEILGDVDEVRVLENRNMSERLVEYLVENSL